MRRAFLFLAAALALLVPATAHAAAPPCQEYLAGDDNELVTTPGQSVDAASPCGDGTYTLAVSTGPRNGSVTISGTTLTYTPNPGFHGTDSFLYTATDDNGTSAPAEIDVLADTAPVCPSATLTVSMGGRLSLPESPCTDADGDGYSVALTRAPQHGALDLSGDIPVYVPTPGFVGTDTLAYLGFDTFFLASDTATLTINVTNPAQTTPPPPPKDTTAPVATLTSARGQTLKQVLAKGLRFTLASNEAGTAAVTVSVDAKTARKLHTKRVVGSASAAVRAGKLDLTVKLTAKARKALKKASKVRLTVSAVVTDAAGNAGRYSTTVTLKR
jgi:hypothetical protein